MNAKPIKKPGNVGGKLAWTAGMYIAANIDKVVAPADINGSLRKFDGFIEYTS